MAPDAPPCEDRSVRRFFASALVLSLALTLPLWPLGCGGSAFLAGPSGSDSGASATTDSSASDSASGDSGASDAVSDSPTPAADAPSDGSCHALTASDTDIYVDSRFAGTPQTGALACPLHTILEGIAAANMLGGPRTVHVAGSAPALVYDESGAVTVGTGITLLGDGELRTTISASGACMTGTCAVLVQGGGIVDGFTVVSPNGDGLWTAVGNAAPIVRNVAASGSKDNGIVALGSVQLGPNIVVNDNGGSGVESPAGATGTVHVVAGLNTFNANHGNGIDLSGSTALDFEGGTASGNGQGIRIASSPPASHTITGLTAKGNTGPGGLVVYGGQTLKLRSSVLVGNTSSGMIYDYVNGSTLDLGTVGDSGGNTFGGMTGSDRNGASGIMLCGAPTVQLAVGDSWAACPPSQVAVMCGGSAAATYADVLYQSSVAGLDPVSGACSVGP